MIDLAQTYEKAGLYLGRRRTARLPAGGAGVRLHPAPREAGLPGRDGAHLQRHLRRAAAARQPYASVLGALLELAGEKAQAVKMPAEKPLDEAWAEPVAFDGCSPRARPKPGQPQPIHIVRNPATNSREHRHDVRPACLHNFLFTVYPYICLAVFLMGSLARFDRDQYTWKSDSSQLLRTGQLRWGSNLFHVGILFLFFGHLVGLLTPHWRVRAVHHGGAEAAAWRRGRRRGRLLCFVGLTCCCTGAVRSAHPADQPPHRHRDPGDPVGAAGARAWPRCRSVGQHPTAA
jgi:hypothetical protein